MVTFTSLTINKSGIKKLPLYIQIESIIRNRILNGHLKPGEKLPREEDMMSQFDVSRITVRKALSDLELEALIVRNPAKGTFVAKDIPNVEKFVINRTLKNILDDARRYRAKVLLIKDIRVAEARNPGDIREFFDLTDDDQICVIKRVRFLKDVPVCFLENYLPVEIGRVLTRTELSQSMLLDAVKEKTGLPVGRGEMYISAVPAEPDIAGLLGLQVFDPLILRQISYWFPDEKPFEIVMYFMRADHFKYKTEMVVGDGY
jgi:GntR family transcriptional regulator